MKTPARFKAETRYDRSQERKANRNLPIMALVGRGVGAAGVANRPAWYWIRLVADDNRVTQCRSLIPLTNGDIIYVRKARDRNLSFYEFVAFIQDAGTGTAPPVQVHDHSSATQGGQFIDLNGAADALVLDAAGNVTISAPIANQIDIEIAGADDFTITANSFNVLASSYITMADDTWIGLGAAAGRLIFDSTPAAHEIRLANGVLDLNGIADALVLDANGDTSISAPTDDQIDVEIGGTDYGTWVEKIFNFDKVTDVHSWYDRRLQCSTPDGDHFRDDAAAVPTGWTEVDAAFARDTNTLYSFFFLQGTNAELSYDYRMQTNVTIEGTSDWNSFLFGPLLFRDGDYTADVDYYFSIHGETAAAFDILKYVRVHLQWNSGLAVWRIQGESDANDGGGQTASGWTTLTAGPLIQPLYFRVVIRDVAGKTTKEYWGHELHPYSHTVLQSVGEVTAWGQVWWRIHQTRGLGIVDRILLGAVDYLVGEA